MNVMGYSLFLDAVEARPSVTSISVRLHIENTTPKPIRSHHPDGFTAQALPQGVEGTDLGVNPVHPYGPTRVVFHHELAPMRGNDPVGGHRPIDHKVLFATVAVGLDEGQGVDDGAMRCRVGPKLQCIQQWREHAPIMPAVGGA